MDAEDLNDVNSCDMEPSRARLKLVAIHLGLSKSNTVGEKHQEFARRICQNVMQHQHDWPVQSQRPTCPNIHCRSSQIIPTSFGSQSKPPPCMAEEAIVRLIRLMEDESSLNCGLGSNLTMSGQVECDASLMSSRTRTWTGVGAVSGCRSPIELASCLHKHRTLTRPMGLVQPNLLVSSGAKRWMRDHCPHLMIPESHLISAGSLARYQRFKSVHDAAVRGDLRQYEALASSLASDQMEVRMDTVGAIAVDWDDNVACAISSGGIMLKHRGRLGQACLPGAGCWADTNAAATTTGVGELLCDCLFAKGFHEHLARQKLLYQHQCLPAVSLAGVLRDCFASFSDVASPASQTAGILAVCSLPPVSDVKQMHLACGHNGGSMCVGFMTHKDKLARVLLLERLDGGASPLITQTIKLDV